MKTLAKVKYLLNKSTSGPVRNRTGTNVEVKKWLLSQFVSEKLVPLIGVQPYPLDELMFMVAVVCYFRPDAIFDWGTHLGKSARIFYETAKEFGVKTQVHTTDLPEETNHKEFPGSRLGEFIRGLPDVYQHRGDGVEESLTVYQKYKNVAPLFFLDGDHSLKSVKTELAKIAGTVPNPVILVHDTFYQFPNPGYNLGPYLAVQDFIKEHPNKFSVQRAELGLPGMTLLYPKMWSVAKSEKNAPEVTVLMPVYNAAKFIRESIESILNQTFVDFEFLIVDDGSADNGAEIIKSYSDPRIKLISNRQNRGVIFSLNKGLKLAKGKYLARMDADDVSLPTRLEKQIDFLNSHPRVGVCASWTQIFDRVRRYTTKFPTRSDDIKATLLFENVVQHPTVVMRTEILQKYNLRYSSEFSHVEDYGLWLGLTRVTDFAILDDVLLNYRLHASQIGQRFGDVQLASVRKIHREEIIRLGINPSANELDIHEKISHGRYDFSREFVNGAEQWLLKLGKANQRTKIYNNRALSKILGKKWVAVSLGCISLGGWLWDRFWRSSLSADSGITQEQKLKFWISTIVSPMAGPMLQKIKSHQFRQLAKSFLLR